MSVIKTGRWTMCGETRTICTYNCGVVLYRRFSCSNYIYTVRLAAGRPSKIISFRFDVTHMVSLVFFIQV